MSYEELEQICILGDINTLQKSNLLNITPFEYCKLFIRSCENGHESIVIYLYKQSAINDIRSVYKGIQAGFYFDKQNIVLLLFTILNPNNKEKEIILEYVFDFLCSFCSKGKIELIKLAYDLFPNPNEIFCGRCATIFEPIPIFLAIKNDQFDIFQFLFEKNSYEEQILLLNKYDGHLYTSATKNSNKIKNYIDNKFTNIAV